MKKIVLTFVFGLLISMTISAQSSIEKRAEVLVKQSIENIEKETKLNPFEKEVLMYVQVPFYKRYLKKIKKLRTKNPEKFKEKIRENRESLKTDLIENLGEARGLEVFNATAEKR